MTLAEALLEPLQYQFVCRGLVMALLLGVSTGLVGCILLLRRTVLVADSFGHALLPGVGLAWLWLGPGLWAMFAGALVAGLFTAVMSGLVNRLTRLKEDAAFGALFAICFAAGVALMSRTGASSDLLHALFGNILGVTRGDLLLAWGVAMATTVFFALAYRMILMETLDPVFHRAVGGRGTLVHLAILVVMVANLVAALQAVGLALALGLFILPAATAYLLCERFGSMLLTAAAVGGLAAMVGLYASFHLHLASGPCMVGSLGAVFLAALVLGREHGLIGRFRRRHRHGHRHLDHG